MYPKNSEKINLTLVDSLELSRIALPELIKSASVDINVDIVTKNIEELIIRLNRTEQIPDICLIDANRPILNSFKTINKLRGMYEDMRILVFSNYDNEYTIGQLFKNGANGFITRTCSLAELVMAVNQVYHHDFYVSDTIPPATRRAIRNIAMKDTIEHSERELEFLQLCAEDFSLKEIAQKMFVSARTVENYREALTKKLKIKSKTGLGIYAVQIGLI